MPPKTSSDFPWSTPTPAPAPRRSTSNSRPRIVRPLFDLIVETLPGPLVDPAVPTQFQANNLDYNDYVGRLAIGRVKSGTLAPPGSTCLCRADGTQQPVKITQIYGWHGLKRSPIDMAAAGDIVAVAGIEDIDIGDTIADREDPRPLPAIRVDEPTISMIFSVNNSPWAGREGEFVTSRKLRERLVQEQTPQRQLAGRRHRLAGRLAVTGRGELQLAIVIETMRREGYELMVSKPTVVTRRGRRRAARARRAAGDRRSGRLHRRRLAAAGGAQGQDDQDGPRRVEPRALGVRRAVARPDRLPLPLPDRYARHRHHERAVQRLGAVARRRSSRAPTAPWSPTAKASRRRTPIFHLQERGMLFIAPGTRVYEGMVVGEYSRDTDLNVNICREKKLTNIRAAGRDENVIITPHREMGLENGIEWIADDELVEVTPQSIRLRKKFLKQADRPRRRQEEED